MIEDVSHAQLLRPGAAALLEAELNGAKAYALKVQNGHVLVRNNDVLPVVDGKTSTKEFVEYAAHRYNLAEPIQEVGTLSSMLFIAGSTNYYHFLMFSLPATIFLRSAPGPRATLGIVNQFAPNTAALIHKLLPQIAGRPVDVVTVPPGDYAARDVIVRAVPMMPFSVAFGRSVLADVLRSLGLDDPTQRPGPLKLFVRRDGGRGGRMLLNQAEIEAWCMKHGYMSVDPGELPLEEQVLLFARATHVIGVEGAALANLVFANKMQRVLVLASPATRRDQFFRGLADCAGIPLTTVYGEFGPDSNTSDRRSNFTIPIETVAQFEL